MDVSERAKKNLLLGDFFLKELIFNKLKLNLFFNFFRCQAF
jgi:hypothetical protein